MDVEKAFDNVDWQFMKSVFEEMSFGEKFLNTIKKIYSEQNATIRINKEQTETFPLERGTRQGCPLLLFIMPTLIIHNGPRGSIKKYTKRGRNSRH